MNARFYVENPTSREKPREQLREKIHYNKGLTAFDSHRNKFLTLSNNGFQTIRKR
jgi:hypothetical protein